MAMGKKSRTKGATGEREAVAVAIELGYRDAKRAAPMQAGHSEDFPDVLGVGVFYIEVKRHKRVSVSGYARQHLGKERPGYINALWYREDGDTEWYVVMKASDAAALERKAYGRDVATVTPLKLVE
jgi:hypothetical protein